MSYVQYNPYNTSWWEWQIENGKASPLFTDEGTNSELPLIFTQQGLAKELSNTVHSGSKLKMALSGYMVASAVVNMKRCLIHLVILGSKQPTQQCTLSQKLCTGRIIELPGT